MITEIKKGDRFRCVDNWYDDDRGNIKLYRDGRVYFSEQDGQITDSKGISQEWDAVGSNSYFIKLQTDQQPNQMASEAIKPDYYKFNIKGTDCSMFDIARALGLSIELFSALKYFRVKGDTAKQINDLEKAKECIDLEIKRLKA